MSIYLSIGKIYNHQVFNNELMKYKRQLIYIYIPIGGKSSGSSLNPLCSLNI
jgi:hypothetical protein